MLVALASGALAGLFNGFWIAYVGLPSLAVTLAGLIGYRGIARILVEDRAIGGYPEWFNTLGQQEEPGLFRVGVDFEGNSAGRSYPYRWGLGKESDLTVKTINGQKYYYLMPNQRVVVSGAVKLVDKSQFNPITPFFWVGLNHEQVQIVNDRVSPTRVTIGF